MTYTGTSCILPGSVMLEAFGFDKGKKVHNVNVGLGKF